MDNRPGVAAMSPPKSVVRQHPERSVPEDARAILSDGLVAHIGFFDGEWPYVIPRSYYYDAESDKIYLHGSPNSRTSSALANGTPVCIEVTILDGLVYSRTALYHSMNYRSVMCFGRAASVTDSVLKEKILHRMIERYHPGRKPGTDYEPTTPKHLKSTEVLEVSILSVSAKKRDAGPGGPNDTVDSAVGSAGVKVVADGLQKLWG